MRKSDGFYDDDEKNLTVKCKRNMSVEKIRTEMETSTFGSYTFYLTEINVLLSEYCAHFVYIKCW